jgi:hypothetical protein
VPGIDEVNAHMRSGNVEKEGKELKQILQEEARVAEALGCSYIVLLLSDDKFALPSYLGRRMMGFLGSYCNSPLFSSPRPKGKEEEVRNWLFL